jgi:hypothetical protein
MGAVLLLFVRGSSTVEVSLGAVPLPLIRGSSTAEVSLGAVPLPLIRGSNTAEVFLGTTSAVPCHSRVVTAFGKDCGHLNLSIMYCAFLRLSSEPN